MPRLVRLYIRHVAIGFALAAIFVALLIGFNVANLRHLILASEIGYVAVVMIVMFNGIVFAGVQFGIAIMRLGEPDDSFGGGGRPKEISVAAAGGMGLRPQRQKRAQGGRF